VLHAQPALLAPPPQGSEDSDVTRPQMYVNKGIMPLLDIGGVDLVLSGHSHSYERSMLIRGCVGGALRLLTTALPQQGATHSVARRMRCAHGPSGVLGRAPLPPSLRCACGVRARLVECLVELVPPPSTLPVLLADCTKTHRSGTRRTCLWTMASAPLAPTARASGTTSHPG
jgi:hypothetical protein